MLQWWEHVISYCAHQCVCVCVCVCVCGGGGGGGKFPTSIVASYDDGSHVYVKGETAVKQYQDVTVESPHYCFSMAPSQYKDCISICRDSHYKDEMVLRSFEMVVRPYLYNGNYWTGKTASLF